MIDLLQYSEEHLLKAMQMSNNQTEVDEDSTTAESSWYALKGNLKSVKKKFDDKKNWNIRYA